MSNRYRIRVYESSDRDGATGSGTVIMPVEPSSTIYAYSAEEAELSICKDISQGKLPAGKVYQICPWLGNAELTRSIAASTDGYFDRVFLDPAHGLYNERRRIRLAKSARPAREENSAFQNELVYA